MEEGILSLSEASFVLFFMTGIIAFASDHKRMFVYTIFGIQNKGPMFHSTSCHLKKSKKGHMGMVNLFILSSFSAINLMKN